jgi:hypothetical protein
MINTLLKLKGLLLPVVKIFLAIIVCAGNISLAVAQTREDTVAYKVYPLHINHDFTITEKLNKPVWNRAQPIYISHEITPNDQKVAPVQTKVKVLYSKDYLYIGFWASDPKPSKIRAHITDRDQFFGDDYVGIILDPFNSNQHAYEIFVNPKGVQMDAKRTRKAENLNFDMIWHTAGAVSDSGYTAVMKIPFQSIHFPSKKDIQNWSINFLRNYPRSNRYQLLWTELKQGEPCLMCHSGLLVGMSGLENSNPINIIPYALGYQSSELNDPDNPASGLGDHSVDGRIGGTITYSPNTISSIDATVNPDFSQVETDATKIGVNKTFALQYDEKRPFFLKKLDVFHTGYNLFYSRTINRPWAAAKYTQTAHKYSIGFLSAFDRNTPFIVPGLLESNTVKSDVNALDNILRGKYNIGSQSHIGGLITTRNEYGGHNYMGSLDWNFFLGHHFYFSGNAAYSNTKELSDTTLFNNSRWFGQSRYDAAFNGEQYGGADIITEFQREAKYYSFGLQYESISPTFQAQNGFVTNTDLRQYKGWQNIYYYPDKSWSSRGGVHTEAGWRYDYANVFKERWFYVEWFNHFAGQTFLDIGYYPMEDNTFRGRLFSKLHSWEFSLSTKPVKALSISGDFEFGKDIYRTMNPKYGRGYNFTASATIKPMPRLQLDLSYQYSTLSSLDHSTTFYSGSISRVEGHYNFSRHLFFRLIAQYNTFTKQIQVYPLLYYKLNPFTKFYIGMTDNLQHVNQFEPSRINAYRQINREFFIKVQYLIRK